jgi:phage terminase small subunit
MSTGAALRLERPKQAPNLMETPPKATKTPSKPSVPKHLRPATRAFYGRMQDLYALEEAGLRTLQLACEAWDRCSEAREELAKAGTFTVGRYGQAVVHPAVGVERDSRLGWLRCIRELALPEDEPIATPRPPTLPARRYSG